ncbi:retrovirus-related pol polyprotein from transposon TNT 1-94 [Tanacetum coccineum]
MRDYESGEDLSEEDAANFVMFVENDPIFFKAAQKNLKWRLAMDAEIEAIEKIDTWELIDLPVGAKKIGVKWVYKTKLNENGEVEKYKARLVAKGYTQEHGIDYTEVFAPVARLEIVHLIISLSAQKGWVVFQLDVKSVFLHGKLTEEVFIEQPQGYEVKGAEQKVYKLKKALYWLKQAPRACYSQIESYFMNEGFKRCPHEHTLFVKAREVGKILIVCIYVDDLIFTRNDQKIIIEFKASMMQEFDMTDLGKMRYFLGIEVRQNEAGIFICQKRYAQEELERFAMDKCNLVQTLIVPGCQLTRDETGVSVGNTRYKQLIGSLMYLTNTQPDIMFVVSLLSRYMERPAKVHMLAAKRVLRYIKVIMEPPTKAHMLAAKRVLRYIKGTSGFGILYKKVKKDNLVAYTDSDYARDDDRKSTSSYIFMMNSGAVSWSSKKQPIVTLSTTKAEFVAAASCACQAVWLRRILESLDHVQRSSTTIYCDNS